MGETNGDLFFDVGVMVLTCMAEGLSDLVLSSNLLVLHLLLLAVKKLYFCCLRLPPSFRVENPILPAAADSCCCLTAAAGVAAVVASFQIVGRKCPPCVCWGRRT